MLILQRRWKSECHDDYDVLGHLDYIVRVAPSKDKNYSYDKYKDAIDPILELLVHSGKGLELNTGASAMVSDSLIPVPMFSAAITNWAARSLPLAVMPTKHRM